MENEDNHKIESPEEIEARIELLKEAEAKISDAIDKIETALKGTPFADEADLYILGHLQTWIGEGNPYDKGTNGYIEDLQEWDGITH